MDSIISTRHGEKRMRQRGMRKRDVALLLACATQVDDEAWMLLGRDADCEIQARKREIQALERLKDRKVVIHGSRIVTAYPSRHSDQKRALKRGRRKGLAR